MNNNAAFRLPAPEGSFSSPPAPWQRGRGSATRDVLLLPTPVTLRRAELSDTEPLATLINGYAAEGLMLAREEARIADQIDSYVVAVEGTGRVVACANLDEYSPSVAEVAAVAVAPSWQGRGLGTSIVEALEQLARRRGVTELFAMSLADDFFLSLGFSVSALDGYPEKRARYRALEVAGVAVVARRCFSKRLD